MEDLTITLMPEQSANIIIGNILLVIKHNDVGVSIDGYPAKEEEVSEPIYVAQLWFDEVESE